MSAMNDMDILSEVKDEELMHNIDSDSESVITLDSEDGESKPPPPTWNEEDEDSEDEGSKPPPPTWNEEDEDSDIEESDIESIDSQMEEEMIEENKSSKKKSQIEETPVTLYNVEDDEEQDEYDSDNEKEYNKLEMNNYQNSLLDYHNTSIAHNSEEISTLAKVIRDDKNNIIDELHRTIPILTKYEKTRVLGQRAKQIENGHAPFVRVADNVFDSSIIAIQELEQKKIPFIIRRPLPSGASEYWHLDFGFDGFFKGFGISLLNKNNNYIIIFFI